MATSTIRKKSIGSNTDHTRYNAYSWLIVGLCASLLFYKYVLNVFPSTMTHELMLTFQISGASLGNLTAFFFYVYIVTQLFAGVLLDRFGGRYLTAIATIIAAAGVFIFAHADVFSYAALGRCLMGFGAAFATVTYLKLTSVWFRVEHRALIGGLLATAVMLGAVFGEAPLAFLVEQWGWRASLILCGIIGLVIGGLFLIFIRDQPASLNSIQATEKLRFKDIVQVLQSWQNWLVALYSGFAFAPFAVLGGLWGNPFLQVAYHLSRTQAGFFISLTFIGFGVGGPVLGYLSDYLGNRLSLMKWGVVLCLISLSCAIYLPLNLFSLGLALFLFGFGTGAYMLCFVVGRELNPVIVAATVITFINTGDSIIGAVTDPLIGKLLDLHWDGSLDNGIRLFSASDYHYGLLLLPAYLILGLLFLMWVKKP